MDAARRFVFRPMSWPSCSGGLDGHDGHSSERDVSSIRDASPLQACSRADRPDCCGEEPRCGRSGKGVRNRGTHRRLRQVYRGMDVGTDKPTPEERQGVPHRLIDLVNPDESFNVGLYRRQALDEIERLYRDSRLPLVVGGTGLYVRTLLKGLSDAPPTDPIVRG